MVLSEIPKTPQWVMLNYFIQLLFLVSSLCTAFAIAMFWLVSRKGKQADTLNRKVFGGKIRLVTLIDYIAFACFLALFIAVTILCLAEGGLI